MTGMLEEEVERVVKDVITVERGGVIDREGGVMDREGGVIERRGGVMERRGGVIERVEDVGAVERVLKDAGLIVYVGEILLEGDFGFGGREEGVA